MYDEDASTLDTLEDELNAMIEDAADLHRGLDVIEVDLTRVIDLFLQQTGRRDLALDFLQSLGAPRGTLH